jgi:hypothetical protein
MIAKPPVEYCEACEMRACCPIHQYASSEKECGSAAVDEARLKLERARKDGASSDEIRRLEKDLQERREGYDFNAGY